MKSRVLPAGSNCSNMNLSFSPAYLRPLLISSFLSIPNPPSPNGVLLPLLLFISLVTFPSSRLLSQHLLSHWYMSHMQPIGENTQLSKMEWHSHLTHLVIFTSMRLLPLLLNRKLPKDWNYVLTHFCTALDALHWWPQNICWTKFEFVSLKKNYSNVFPNSRYTVKFSARQWLLTPFLSFCICKMSISFLL